MSFMDILQYLPWFIVGILLVASAVFFRQFFSPSRRLHNELDIAILKMSEIKQRLGLNPIVDLDEIRAVMITDELKHLWREYAETLHPQKHDDGGQLRITRYRATAMAEVFFSEQALIETPLKTAFYKHLPGILTGLGIIGTFSGLIFGLQSFDINPTKVQESLGKLIGSVSHAFVVSAIAITLAMLCTWWTNRELTLRYRQVEKLCQIIDSFFNAGAGEEYLARLVEASETSATQSIQLKDALVTDLKEILTELTDRQIREMSSGIGQSFADSLREPMDRISKAVEGVGANQGDAVNSMLTDVLADFSGRMEKMFGGQLSGMSELLLETSQAMQATAARFDKLASNMDDAGKNAAETMTEKLNNAITSMEGRQAIMNQQMGNFVEQIRVSISQSQTESSQKLQETLSELGKNVANVIGQIQEQTGKNADTQTHAVANLSGSVETLITQLVRTSGDLQTSVSSLTATTTSSIDRMNSGAEALAIAAHDFARAGQGVAGTMNAATNASEKIQTSAQSLSLATNSAEEMFRDYRETSESFAIILTELKMTIETAHRLNSAETKAVEETANYLDEKILSMEIRQNELNKQMGEFVEKIRVSVSQSQTESSHKLQETLSELGKNVANVIAQIQKQTGKNADTQTQAVTNLSESVETLITQLVKTSSDLNTSVSTLTSATTSSIDRMNSGAERLANAANDFAKAGQGVAGTMNASAEATGKIQSSSQLLSLATGSAEEMFSDYRETSESFASMLTDLKITMDTAKKEAGLTTQLVGQLKSAAEQLGNAQVQADEYLKGINRVLTTTHQEFGAALKKTLDTANTGFQKELGTAVGLLSGSIKDLGDTLDDLPTRKG